MTETTTAHVPLASPRPLYRDPDTRKLAGVCDALARYTDTDPVIWRIVTVVLTIFGGTGGILYLLGWVLIPKRAADGTVPESWLSRNGRSITPASLVVIAIVALVLLGGFDDGQGVAAVTIVGLVAYLVHRERRGSPVAPSYVGAEVPPAPANESVPYVRVPRERSRLGLLTISVTALVSGALAVAALAGTDGLTTARITAVAVLVVGAGLVVGAWYGRARWLVLIGLLLSLGLGAAAALDYTGGTLRGGVGDRTWVVGEGRPSQSFSLGVGEATLDLSELASEGQHVVIHSSVSLGHLVIVVPADVPVRVHATARIGDITEFGKSLVSGDGDIERTRSYGPPGDPRVEVEATIGTGQIEVRHA